jgi:hypothetical protein
MDRFSYPDDSTVIGHAEWQAQYCASIIATPDALFVVPRQATAISRQARGDWRGTVLAESD